jgi:hypothetical protein
MQWSQLTEHHLVRYGPLITPTLRFAMNTYALHQRFLRESEKALQPQTSRAKEVVGHGAKVALVEGLWSPDMHESALGQNRATVCCQSVSASAPTNEGPSQT